MKESKSSQLSHDVEYCLSNLTKPWGSATGVEHRLVSTLRPQIVQHLQHHGANSAECNVCNSFSREGATLQLQWLQCLWHSESPKAGLVSVLPARKPYRADSWILLTSPGISWQCLQRLQQIDPHKMGQTRRSTKHSNRSRPCRRRCWFHPGGKKHVMSSLRRPSRGSVVWVVSVLSLSRPNKLKALGPCSTGHTCTTKCRFTNYTEFLKHTHREAFCKIFISIYLSTRAFTLSISLQEWWHVADLPISNPSPRVACLPLSIACVTVWHIYKMLQCYKMLSQDALTTFATLVWGQTLLTVPWKLFKSASMAWSSAGSEQRSNMLQSI